MKVNVGGLDRVARVVIGIALIVHGFFAQEPWAYLGVIPLATGLFGFCPAYCIFGFSTTCKKEDGCCQTK